MIFANCDLKVIVLVIKHFFLIYVIYHFNLHNKGFVLSYSLRLCKSEG
jgi:hypothetical protein